MYDNLVADRPKIEIKIEYLRSKAIKELKKARKFPAVVTYKYKIPATLNEHIIYFFAESRFYVDKPTANSFFPLFHNKSRYAITTNKAVHKSEGEFLLIKCVEAYSSHFFDRYNERFLKDNTLGRNEIIALFFGRNKYFLHFKMNEDINRNFEKYGTSGQLGSRIRDGYCFTDCEQFGVLCRDKILNQDVPKAVSKFYKTYINESDMHESQTEAIKKGELERRKSLIDKFGIEKMKEMKQAFARL